VNGYTMLWHVLLNSPLIVCSPSVLADLEHALSAFEEASFEQRQFLFSAHVCNQGPASKNNLYVNKPAMCECVLLNSSSPGKDAVSIRLRLLPSARPLEAVSGYAVLLQIRVEVSDLER